MDGFQNGFSLQFTGSREGYHRLNNLRLRVGNKKILWDKIMKEVKAKRYCGPFKDWPKLDGNYGYQNPIGLVPKGEVKLCSDEEWAEQAEGSHMFPPGHEHWNNSSNCWLIFHLSHRFGKIPSVNEGTSPEFCKVTYQGVDDAVREASKFEMPFASKTDGVSAFSHIPVRKADWNLMIM